MPRGRIPSDAIEIDYEKLVVVPVTLTSPAKDISMLDPRVGQLAEDALANQRGFQITFDSETEARVARRDFRIYGEQRPNGTVSVSSTIREINGRWLLTVKVRPKRARRTSATTPIAITEKTRNSK